MKLTDAQMNKILYYLRKCYEAVGDNVYVEEDNYIFFPPIEFIRDTDGKWTPQ